MTLSPFACPDARHISPTRRRRRGRWRKREREREREFAAIITRRSTATVSATLRWFRVA